MLDTITVDLHCPNLICTVICGIGFVTGLLYLLIDYFRWNKEEEEFRRQWQQRFEELRKRRG